MEGTCLSPIAILCEDRNGQIKISGKILSYEGNEKIYKEKISSFQDIAIDIMLFADEFILEGAKSLILKNDN